MGLYVLIKFHETERITSLTRSAIERLVAAGLFPKPVRVTAHRLAFIREEVEQWTRDRIAARDEKRRPEADPILAATSGKRGLKNRLGRSAK